MTDIAPGPREVFVYQSTRTGIPRLEPYVRGIWNRRLFMWHMARTELKARHYDTALGQLWIILNPLLMAAVYFFLRTVIRPIGNVDRNFFIDHIIWSVFFFTYTATSLRSGARSVLENKQMVLNTAFPRAVFPIVAVLTALLDFIPTLFIFFIVHAVLGQPFGISFLMLPAIIAVLTVFNLGCALFWAPLTILYRDVGGLLPFVTQIWIYATPVLYTTQEIPPNLLPYLRLNPLYSFWSVLEEVFSGRMPSLGTLLATVAWAAVVFVVGAIPFLRREREFAIRF